MPSLGAVKAGEAFVDMSIRDKNVRQQLAKVQGRFKAMAKSIAVSMAAAAAAATAVAAGLGFVIKAATSVGDKLHKMSIRTGFSAESLSELYHAADLSGASLDSLEKAVKRMAVVLLDAGRGLKDANDSLADIGLSVKTLDGLSPEQQFLTIAGAIADVDDETRRAALAQKIFGRAGTQLLPLLAEGKAGLEAMREEARRLGLTWSQDDVEAAAKLNDAINTVKRQMVRFGAFLGTEMADTLVGYLKSIQDIIAATQNWAKQNQFAGDALKGILDPLVAFKVLRDGIKLGGNAIRGGVPGRGGIGSAANQLAIFNALGRPFGGSISGIAAAGRPSSPLGFSGSRTPKRYIFEQMLGAGAGLSPGFFGAGAGAARSGVPNILGGGGSGVFDFARGLADRAKVQLASAALGVKLRNAKLFDGPSQQVASRASLSLRDANSASGYSQRVAALRQQADSSKKLIALTRDSRDLLRKLTNSAADFVLTATDLGN